MAQVQIEDIIGPVAQHVIGCNLTSMVDAYIRAARELCNKSYWYRSTLLGSTTADEPLYNLGSDTYNEILGVAAVGITLPDREDVLRPGDSSTWDANDETGEPQFYQYVPHGQLAIHKTPDDAYPLQIVLVLQPKLQSNSIDDALLVHWSEVLNQGALSHLLAIKRMPWTDLGEAGIYGAKFQAGIRSARSDSAAGHRGPALPAGTAPGARVSGLATGRQVL